MAYINSLAQEINVKLAWLTPPGGLGQVQALYRSIREDLREEAQHVRMPSGEVMSFAFCPAALGAIRGHRLRLHVYAGVLGDPAERGLLVKGADAIIVVDDADLAGVPLGSEPVVRGTAADAPHGLLKSATRAVLIAMKQGTGAPPTEPREPARAAHPRERRVGPYPVLLPEWCDQTDVVAQPPLYRLDGVHAQGVSFTFAVWVDQGGPDAAERALADAAAGWQAETTERHALTIEGVTFEGIWSRGIARDPSLTLVETYVGTCGPDLLAFTILHGSGGADQATMQRLFHALVAGAIVRAVSDNPGRYR